MGGSSGPAPLKVFPLRPPKPTRVHHETLAGFAPAQPWVLMSQVANDLEKVLQGRGMQHGFYPYGDDGFAVVTNLENFRKDGAQLPEDQRWSREIPPPKLSEWLNRLITAPVGTYRMFVIFISPEPPEWDTSGGLTEDAARAIANQGALVLPQALRQRRVTDQFHLTIAVYEYKRTDMQRTASFDPVGSLTAEAHAKAIGLLPFPRS